MEAEKEDEEENEGEEEEGDDEEDEDEEAEAEAEAEDEEEGGFCDVSISKGGKECIIGVPNASLLGLTESRVLFNI